MKPIFLFLILSLFVINLAAQDGRNYTKAIKKHRKHYKKEFLEDTRSPLEKKELKYLRFFEPKQEFLVECSFRETPNEKPFELATYSGITKPYRKYGELSFEIDGQPYSLAVYQSLRLIKMPQYKDYLFIPFKDFTNGESTYGGGRYMDIKTTDIVDDKLYLDFNKCYNPWCAYSDGYNCPIPPKENHLEVAIEAGEKEFGKK